MQTTLLAKPPLLPLSDSLMPQSLTRSHLRRLIGEPDFSRGEAYWSSRQVKSAKLREGRKMATGEVRGSRSKAYRQDIALEWAQDGGLNRLRGHCSCPVGYNCKHVAAVMLSLLTELNATQEQPPLPKEPDVPPEIGGWLKRFEHINEPAKPAKPAEQTEKLYYILRSTPAGALEIDLMKVRILKSGDLSKSLQRYSLPAWANHGGSKFLDFNDNGILGKLQHLKRLGLDTISGLRIHANDVLGETLTGLIQEIIATGRAKPFTLQHPSLAWAGPARGRMQWQERPDGTQKLTVVSQDGRELETLPLIPPLYVDLRQGRCGPLLTGTTPELAHALVTMPPVPPKAARDIVTALTKTQTDAPLPRQIETEQREGIRPAPILRLFAQTGELRPLGRRYAYNAQAYETVTIPALRLSFDYEGQIVDFSTRRDPEFREDNKLVSIKRIPELEDAAFQKIASLSEFGISEIGALEQEVYGLKKRRPRDLMIELETSGNEDSELDHLILDFTREIIPALEEDGWRVEIDESWPYRFYDGPLQFEAKVEKSQTDWFSFSLRAQADDQELDLLPAVLGIIEILPLDANGELSEDYDLEVLLGEMTLFLDLPDGSRAPVEGTELIPLVQACLAAHALLGGFHLGEASEARKLAKALEGSGVRWQGSEELLELGRKLQALSQLQEIPPPPSLKGDLRHYQKTGYGWLKALRETGFGGVLADDMGLGKTIQALSLLCQCHLEEHANRPSLLVVPTSLLGNWQREAARFAPELELLILHGPGRSALFDAIPDHHLVITTYPLLHRDHKTLFKHTYELAILDEAQAVKNPAASVAKRIREIDAKQRLALTGTPIENNLEELWAIYDWVVPGLLGNRKVFRNTFRHPIEHSNDDAARQKLATRIRPFLLRRTKEEVATDLPPKTEIDEIIRLEGDQRALYETVRVAMDSRVREAIAARGIAATRITVLDALLKMRQICCDPALARLDAAKEVKTSAKRARLLEMIGELLAEGRKVLIFSQFVEMLRLIEQDVQELGVDYALFTGKTRNRADQIDKFQSGRAQLFLISLKAGGVGLNLTAADTVIIYDPWWNPAVERQAMDRAHRIGQDKPVFVYRMIAEGSVEAAISEMQAKKQALTDKLFEGADGGGIGMDEGDIRALFAPLN